MSAHEGMILRIKRLGLTPKLNAKGEVIAAVSRTGAVYTSVWPMYRRKAASA
jgi:hypothetical protein